MEGKKWQLLQAELDRDSEVHGDRLAIQSGRLVLPLAQRVHGRLVQQGRAGNDFHRGYASRGINQRIDAYVARYVLCFRQRWINRRHGRNHVRRLHFTAHNNGCRWSLWLF